MFGTVIGKNVSFEGDYMRFDENARVDCHDIVAYMFAYGEQFVIDENARIIGDVYANVCTVGGYVHGNIYAQRVKVLSTGNVQGNVTSGFLETESGGRVKGIINTEDTFEQFSTSDFVEKYYEEGDSADQQIDESVATDSDATMLTRSDILQILDERDAEFARSIRETFMSTLREIGVSNNAQGETSFESWAPPEQVLDTDVTWSQEDEDDWRPPDDWKDDKEPVK